MLTSSYLVWYFQKLVAAVPSLSRWAPVKRKSPDSHVTDTPQLQLLHHTFCTHTHTHIYIIYCLPNKSVSFTLCHLLPLLFFTPFFFLVSFPPLSSLLSSSPVPLTTTAVVIHIMNHRYLKVSAHISLSLSLPLSLSLSISFSLALLLPLYCSFSVLLFFLFSNFQSVQAKRSQNTRRNIKQPF